VCCSVLQWIYIYVYTYIHVFNIYVYIHVCMFIYIYEQYIYTYTYIYMYIRYMSTANVAPSGLIHLYMYIWCIYMCVFIYMYIYIVTYRICIFYLLAQLLEKNLKIWPFNLYPKMNCWFLWPLILHKNQKRFSFSLRLLPKKSLYSWLLRISTCYQTKPIVKTREILKSHFATRFTTYNYDSAEFGEFLPAIRRKCQTK